MSNKKYKTIIVGTPEFGVPAFRRLIEAPEFNVMAAITQPDKKVGRKQVLTQSPVKILAEKHNIPVWQPARISDFQFPISEIDLIVVIAYAQIIPKSLLKWPKYGCINVHASLLPKYRGAACIQAPILNGDHKTGITVMLMNEGLDTGPVIDRYEIDIAPEDTTGKLHDKLSRLAEQKIVTSLNDYLSGKLLSSSQDNSKSSYVKTLKKEDGKIDWHKSAQSIERHIRAMQPWPGSYSLLPDGKKIIIHQVRPDFLGLENIPAGTIKQYEKELIIAAADKCLLIDTLQIEGKNPITGQDFFKGYKKYENVVLT